MLSSSTFTAVLLCKYHKKGEKGKERCWLLREVFVWKAEAMVVVQSTGTTCLVLATAVISTSWSIIHMSQVTLPTAIKVCFIPSS